VDSVPDVASEVKTSPWPGGRPLERGIGLPAHRLEAVGQQLRDLSLDEIERQPVDLQLGVLLQCFQGVIARREAVHQEQRNRRIVLGPQVKHLAHDHVEEGLSVLYLEQRFRPRHSHARPETSVELEHDDAAEG
jgi:hypothetical protein